MTRVLIIDDDESIRGALGILLRHHGYDAVMANDAQSGLAAFDAAQFDAVFVDLFMPGVTGLDAIKMLRKRAAALPIVAMTGFRFPGAEGGAADFMTLALERGASLCLRKPFGPEQLTAVLDQCLGQPPESEAVRA